MPWNNQSNGGNNGGGPWGQGPSGGGSGGGPGPGPDIEQLFKKGKDQFKGGIPGGRTGILLILLLAVAFWGFNSFYRVQPDEVGIELFLGKAKAGLNDPGLHFHIWPIESVETPKVKKENRENVTGGAGQRSSGNSLMLTGDQNIIDVRFTILWRISNARAYLFNVTDQSRLVRVIAESSMRALVAQRSAEAVRTTERAEVTAEARILAQETLDGYESGIQVISVQMEQAEPPAEVQEAFNEVQRAQQDESRFVEDARKYSNRVLGDARGQSAQIREAAEAYRGRVVAEAVGEASRFISVYEEYAKASEVTRKRMFLETMERVLATSDKVILEGGAGQGGSGVLPYLPLPEIQKRQQGAQ